METIAACKIEETFKDFRQKTTCFDAFLMGLNMQKTLVLSFNLMYFPVKMKDKHEQIMHHAF